MFTNELKSSIRIIEKEKRTAISEEQKASFGNAIFNKIISLDQYNNSFVILTYVSCKGEPDTIKLIKHSIHIGKTTAVPYCATNNGILNFYIITDLNQLKSGSFGLLEPDVNICEKLEHPKNGFCAVPGLCFDIFGNRIGYGKGYYDRFLQHFSGFKAGLCYSSSLSTKKLPCESFDIPCNAVITEDNIYFV